MTGSTVLISLVLALALLGAAACNAIPSLHAQMPWLTELLVALALGNAVTVCVVITRFLRVQTRERDLSMNLETANIKLTELDRMKSEFLSFASHQIKAPMSVVKGYATLIMDGSFGPVSREIGDVAGKIKDSADRMIGLVNTLLDLRRLDEGRMTYEFEELELGKFVASVVDEFRPLAADKGLALVLQPVPRQWRVRADAQHLRQVMQNLIENAIKYTDKGSVTVSISEGPAGTVRVAVADTGRGISADLLPKLFEQFTRDQSIAKEIAGTGLGLYIARSMILAHNGKIWATSPGSGKGSTFIIELPLL